MSAQRDYLSLPMRAFLADLAARSPTPGGGSLAALLGALAASQAQMVIAYTLGKKKHNEHEGRLRALLDEFKRAADALSQLMSEDMAAYERYAASRKSDETDEQQRAVATAIAVPMEVVVLAEAVAARLDEVKSFVNPYLFSDLQAAAILAFAAARSAGLNVRVNLEDLADRREADRLESQLDALIDRVHQHRQAVVHHQPA